MNKRGIKSRQHFLDVAIEVLAQGGPDTVSANLIARRAGVTWGTIEHQFGASDGVWAAILDELLKRAHHFAGLTASADASLKRRVTFIVETLWNGHASPHARAVQNLRLAIPRDHEALTAALPKTEAALHRWDIEWQSAFEQLFDGLALSKTKVRRARSLVPGAVRGLYAQNELTTFTDMDEGRRALIDALVAYLK